MAAGIDLFYLLVENVFGSVLLSGLGLAIGMWMIGMWGKMSPYLLIVLTGTFVMAFSIGYIGGLGVLIWGIIGLYYLSTGAVNWVNSMRS